MSKDERGRNSSFSEKPVRSHLRRLADWINLTGAKKVHSLIDKVYKRKNLEMAWEKVKENRGSGGVDGQSLAAFSAQLGVELHPQKTRIVHVQDGFEFLGYKIKRGQRKLRLPESKICSQARQGALYAYPKGKSIRRFMDQVRQRTKRRIPLKTKELIAELNPLLRGWGEYYKRAHVRLLFNRLDRWIIRRIWSHRYKRWRNAGWKRLPPRVLYREHGLVNLVRLIPSLASRFESS
jgi:hypothetical protein